MGIGILFGDDRFLDVVGEFVANAADPVTDILGSGIDIMIEFEFDNDSADLFTRFAAENFDSGNVVQFLFQGLCYVGFDQFRVGPGVDGGDGDNGGINVGKFADGKAGEGYDADDHEGQVEHDGGDRPPNAELGERHGVAAGVSGSSLRPGERRRLPDRAT